MIGRFPQRPPRRQHQDFHFFAAPDPIANLSSQFTRLAATQPAPPSMPERTENPVPPTMPAPEPQPPAAPAQTIVTLIGPAEVPPVAPPPPEPARARPVSKSRSKPRARKATTTARLAAPRRNRPSPVRQPSPAADSRSDHELRCTICSHPDRAEIENEFMHWHAIGHIAYDYEVSRSAIYRHAHAFGLFARRNRNLRFALGHLIERVQDVDPTADSIVRAIHAFARINDEGEWIEPPAHVIVSSGGIHREAAAPPARRPISIPLDSQTISSVIDVTPEPVLPGTVNQVNDDATP
jgi:hypothetical protein